MSVMSNVRSILPEVVNDTLMYAIGNVRCLAQPYINNEFTASAIKDNLYVGDLASASNSEALQENGITHIVTVFNGGIEMYPDNFKYKIIHINDDPWVNIGNYFDETIEFIDEALSDESNKVMVHCQRGVSRSVTLVAAYILYKVNQQSIIHYNDVDSTIEKVLTSISSKRDIAQPNEGFVKCLRDYLCRINGGASVSCTQSASVSCDDSAESIESPIASASSTPIMTPDISPVTSPVTSVISSESNEMTRID
jgi:protein tyrosine phosphatase (PTP) superfamily phosphohydrolase (DUF442 family)